MRVCGDCPAAPQSQSGCEAGAQPSASQTRTCGACASACASVARPSGPALPSLTRAVGSRRVGCGARQQLSGSDQRPRARAAELATACCCPGEGRARRGRGGRRASHSCRGGGVWDPDARASPASSLRARGFIVCNAQARRPVASLGLQAALKHRFKMLSCAFRVFSTI